MVTIQIEHGVKDFATWKAAFDRDPLDRPSLGVRSFRVSQLVDDERLVVIELEVDDLPAAEHFVELLKKLWDSNGAVPEMLSDPEPRVRLLDVVDNQTQASSVGDDGPVQEDDRPRPRWRASGG